ncbi:MAG: integrase, partial [Deltaproteobacteria bacterium]|nr:integrase [Deltaproteobacteria bacterium]
RCNGWVIRRTLGPLEALTVEDARHAARAVLAEAEAGDGATTVLTMRAFARVFLADCAGRWKPATRENYAGTVRRWILPAFGNRLVDAVSAKEVRIWIDGITASHPGSANWALAAMSSLMKHTETLGFRLEDSNPCRGLRRRKTGFEAHYLTDDEFAALGEALDGAEAEHPIAVAALRFLLYTGARKSEALRLRWEDVHGDHAVLSDSKTGPHTI